MHQNLPLLSLFANWYICSFALAVLHFPFAADALAYLQSKGIKPDFHQYDEGHTINKQMFDDVNLWLKTSIAQ